MSNLEPEQVRQGKKGTPVLLILIAGLVLALIAFLAVGAYGWFLPDSDLSTDRPAIEAPAVGSEPTGTVVAPENSG
ncbi:MAG TPA: hypothetical protein VIN77_01520 [Aurantimonas sp.]|uniref:Uncharacterized protein n=1 Tax=Aurantimonas marianensis TaxID=2920428 RepID=A0A9X2H9S9_9HYPH|nr:hypothetical protein [Aurantimonas marianensis]MCP3055908.1 hypothetical protein [Aurantimonas marianensis]